MPSSLKNQVIKSIESADEKLLRLIQALISGYHSDDSAISTVAQWSHLMDYVKQRTVAERSRSHHSESLQIIPDWFYQELHKDRMNYLSEQDGAEDWESIKRKLKRKY